MNVAKDDKAPAAAPKAEAKVDVKVENLDLPKQEDMKPGVPDQHPPQAGPTARIDGDPNKPGEKL